MLLRYYEIESEFFQVLKNYKKALYFHKLYTELYQNLFEEKKIASLQELQERFETKRRLEKISELTENNREKNTIINIQKEALTTRNIVLLFLVLLLLVLFGIYLYWRQKQKLKEQQAKLQKIEEVLEGQEHIKEAISQDLHDIIATKYDGIRLKLIAAKKSKERDTIDKILVQDIQDINHEIRLISHRLSPLGKKIENTSLREIIISQLSEFQYYRNIFIEIQLPLPEELETINLNTQTNFYGILLEIFNNIEKHSMAKKVSVTHKKIDDILHFSICDNGVGFKPQKTKGIGIVNIKQRVELMGGEYSIKGSTSGTCISFSFPIKENIG